LLDDPDRADPVSQFQRQFDLGAHIANPGVEDRLGARNGAAILAGGLQRDGALDDEAAGTLTSAARLYLDLLQLVRTAHGSGFDPSQAAKGFSDRLVRTAGAESIEGLAERLDTASVQVRQQFEALIHPLS
jgi:glutamate-ammonia-ligase adenylyltransferase